MGSFHKVARQGQRHHHGGFDMLGNEEIQPLDHYADIKGTNMRQVEQVATSDDRHSAHSDAETLKPRRSMYTNYHSGIRSLNL